jgi:hypothetical protein
MKPMAMTLPFVIMLLVGIAMAVLGILKPCNGLHYNGVYYNNACGNVCCEKTCNIINNSCK